MTYILRTTWPKKVGIFSWDITTVKFQANPSRWCRALWMIWHGRTHYLCWYKITARNFNTNWWLYRFGIQIEVVYKLLIYYFDCGTFGNLYIFELTGLVIFWPWNLSLCTMLNCRADWTFKGILYRCGHSSVHGTNIFRRNENGWLHYICLQS